ncbi:hypothetical protein CAC42_1072 [Sphaceloma murrayae]|uniref:Uncharacterized protein n=1 Tax=Sphaceloma murrayae TaxID=2082308 RepID=A0A2K1R284_9PEZI|nr:hypothetical protein CAC42_1072 [Sphaceloma murrayae]
MSSRILSQLARGASRQSTWSSSPLRTFSSTVTRRQTTGAMPVRKPVGAFRGGILGFLLGSTLAGSALYYYVIDEYKVSNELLTEDIYTLQSAVQRIEGYVRSLEEKAGVNKKS